MPLSLDFLDMYDEELRAMNSGRVDRPFTLTRSYVVFLAVVRYLFGFAYWQLEGFTRALNRLVPRFSTADYSGLRKRILHVDLSPYKDLEGLGDVNVVAVDSTGVEVHRGGDELNANTKKRNGTSHPLCSRHRDERATTKECSQSC